MINKIDFVNKKYIALENFKKSLLTSRVGNYIAKITLFGSLRKNLATYDSDIDLLIFATRYPEEIQSVCDRLSSRIFLTYSENIEPLVYCSDQLRNPQSYFIYINLKKGKEVYKMNEKELRREDAIAFCILAKEYKEIARDNFNLKRFRGTCDAGYNAVELCLKSLLLLKLKDLPTTHQGVLDRFNAFYIKSGFTPKKIADDIKIAFRLRNLSRYDPHAKIEKDDANLTLNLIEDILKISENYLYR